LTNSAPLVIWGRELHSIRSLGIYALAALAGILLKGEDAVACEK